MQTTELAGRNWVKNPQFTAHNWNFSLMENFDSRGLRCTPEGYRLVKSLDANECVVPEKIDLVTRRARNLNAHVMPETSSFL